MSEQKPGGRSGTDTEQIRLISREDAEHAIASGEAISKQSFPTVVDDEAVIDLRASSPGSEVSLDKTHSLPHWTEPATGEVPIVLAKDRVGATDMNAPKWRSNHFGWAPADEASFEDLSEASRLGERSKLANGDEGESQAVEVADEVKGETEVVSGDDGGLTEGTERPGGLGSRFRAGDQSDDHSTTDKAPEDAPASPQVTRTIDSVSLIRRAVTAGAVAAAALGAFALGPSWVLVLVSAVLMFAAAEYFDALRRVGFRPATVLGLLAIAGLIGGAYARGEAALPLVMTLAVVFTFLWYLVGIIKDRPTANTAVTLLGVLWIGLLGSYAALMLRLPDREGVAFLIGAVLVTIAYDTAAYLGGTMFGHHKLSKISPNKSWEGAAAGTLAAMVVGAGLVALVSPWSVGSGILLGLIASVLVPLGDLAESNVKRDLGLKDMGRILPGHGGVLDRFDGMLLVLPATYYLALLLHG